MSRLGLVGRAGNTQALTDVLGDLGARSAADPIHSQIDQLTQSPATGIGLFVGILGAVWVISPVTTRPTARSRA